MKEGWLRQAERNKKQDRLTNEIENEREKKGKEERKGDWQEMMNDEQTRKRRDDWKMIELKFGKIDRLIERKRIEKRKKVNQMRNKQTNKQKQVEISFIWFVDLLRENWRERTNKMKREIDRWIEIIDWQIRTDEKRQKKRWHSQLFFLSFIHSFDLIWEIERRK